MIIVDTNIVSEVMRTAPAPVVIEWLNRQETLALFLASTSIAEIEYGLAMMPSGKRRNGLRKAFDQFVTEAFEHRILVFDRESAAAYGELMGKRKQKGRPMSVQDGQIIAIAKVHGFAIATRNIKDFKECGIKLINPFE